MQVASVAIPMTFALVGSLFRSLENVEPLLSGEGRFIFDDASSSWAASNRFGK